MKKLTLKTFALLAAIAFAISAVAFLCLWIALPNAEERSSRQRLEEETERLVSELRIAEKGSSERLFTDFVRNNGALLVLLDDEGYPVSPYTFERTGDICDDEGIPFRFADSEEDYVLITRYDGSRADELTRALLVSIPFVAITAAVLCAVGAWFFSKYTTQPIIRIGKIAERISDLDFGWYCPDLRDDEIGMLSGSINEMSDKLRTALDELNLRNSELSDEIALEKERERRRMLFFSGVSHELKTPIAVVIGQLEGIQAGIGVYKDSEKYLARSAEILRSLSGFINEVLAVSHLDISDETERDPVDISAAVRSLADEYADYAADGSVSLSTDIRDGVAAYGDEKLFEKALGNILGNAVAYTPEGGRIVVQLCDKTLTVENSPAHIGEEHLPHLFEAFYRADASSGQGSGLGLYITRMIFEKYGVGCKIENTDDGVRFTVAF